MSNVDLRNEHEAVRTRVGFHDFTHEMLEVKGPDAGAFLDKMFVNNISGSDVGEGQYTTMLNESGIIIDDVIIFRMEDDLYWVSTLYIQEMFDWFGKYSDGFDVEFTDIKHVTTMYAVQGPKSAEVINDFLDENIDDLNFSRIRDNTVGDVPVRVARFGFTGELGYELYFHPDHVELIEEKLLESGKSVGIKKLETDVVLSSLPSEKGYILMRDVDELNPVEAGLGWTVDWDSDFVGKSAIESSKGNPKRSLIGFTVDNDTEVELESDIKKDGEVVGKVTNCAYGFTVDEMIGYCIIDNAKAKIGDKVTIGNDNVEATLTERVFYDPEDERRRGVA